MVNEAIFDLVENQKESYRLRLAPQDVTGHGGAEAPHLIFYPKLFSESRDGHTKTQLFGSEIEALAVSIYKSNDSYPAFTSGLRYFIGDGTGSFCMLPVTLSFIDLLQKVGQIRISFDVWLSPDLCLNGRRIIRTTTQVISIDQSHWYTKVLPQLGYPETRLVPLNTSLPKSLASLNEPARTTWKRVHQRLRDAEQAILRQSNSASIITNGVNALRDVVDGALRTWLAVWGYIAPDKQEDINVLLQNLNSGIPQCNAPEGKTKSKPHITNDNMRLCSHAIALHNIATLTNPTHHFGTQTIYTPTDAESWLLMTIGEIRSLPELWLQFPSPPRPLIPPDSNIDNSNGDIHEKS